MVKTVSTKYAEQFEILTKTDGDERLGKNMIGIRVWDGSQYSAYATLEVPQALELATALMQTTSDLFTQWGQS